MSRTRAVLPSRTVERFLGAVVAGAGIPPDLYAPDAVLDATVPGWRLRCTGPRAITDQYASWFADPARFEELQRCPLADGGEVVTYLLAWEEDGSPMASRHGHLLVLDDEDRIRSDTAFCGGRWSAALLAEMAEAGL